MYIYNHDGVRFLSSTIWKEPRDTATNAILPSFFGLLSVCDLQDKDKMN